MDESSDDRSPNPIDVHVGERVRRRRRALGVSQEQLADKLGLTFQQVQKYERGANRISCSKLYQIASALQAHIAYFFDGLPDPVRAMGVAEDSPAAFVHDLPLTPEERLFIGSLSRIESKQVRKRLLELVKSLVDSSAEESV